jgi:2-amino-4-hydroxy-6-hydroxymethyldihydropteridine diphosphokinase
MGVNIGSHGERLRLLMLALQSINALPATRVLAVSSLYETPPWGVTDQAEFYNCVVGVSTGLQPMALLRRLKAIEAKLGRKHRQRWGPREIDLDIVLLGKVQLSLPGLTIPHKHLAERKFVLVPLLELNSMAALPSGRSIESLARSSETF